ncbi:MAG TPA: hypothetical protein VLB44_27595 [Kofleriaceae bacterium]|nr:hypothetical protein [Kofleriaceae bacterium]
MAKLKCLCLASVLGALAGCGTEPDSRPVTFEVVTLEVLQPSCGQVQCHSTSTWTQGYAFDTLDAARESFRFLSGNELLNVIKGGEEDRMPPDVPLADLDLDLLTRWIQAGRPGL